MKTHLRILGVDRRNQGQTEYEHDHQTACGYVRCAVTFSQDAVDCFYCIRSEEMKHYRQLNSCLTDSQGCY